MSALRDQLTSPPPPQPQQTLTNVHNVNSYLSAVVNGVVGGSPTSSSPSSTTAAAAAAVAAAAAANINPSMTNSNLSSSGGVGVNNVTLQGSSSSASLQQQQSRIWHPPRIAQRKQQFRVLSRNEKISRLATHSCCKVSFIRISRGE